MSASIDLVARLRAFQAGRAQPIASHLQVAIQPHAVVLCPIAMAGEDTTVHIIACGRVGKEPTIYAVADPRFRDDRYRLFEWLSERVDTYFQWCRDAQTFPQLWVSSPAAAGHLDLLAERLRYNRENARVKRFGELLSYATDRYPIAGQQALLTATTALRAHWATGQQPAEDEHLGALLTWIEPPAGSPILTAVADAERVPMGFKTDPDFDRDVLEPLVEAFNAARRSGSTERLPALEARIQTALEPVARAIYDATQRAIALLQGAGLPPLPDLAAIEQREIAAFDSFMRSRDAGYGLALRDGPRAAAFKFAERENAVETTAAALIMGDRVARARARLAGDVVRGRVENPIRIRTAPRQFEYRFDLVTTQSTLHVRVRDELAWADDPRLMVEVAAVRREGTTTRLSLRMTAGTRAPGLPANGASLELVPGIPNWKWLGRTRSQMSKRLGVTPWTHTDGPVPQSPARPAPADPLAAVEALR